MVVPRAAVDKLAEVSDGDELLKGGEEVGPRAVRHRVETHLDQLLLEVGVPEVLDLVVSPAREVGSNRRPPKLLEGSLHTQKLEDYYQLTSAGNAC